MGLSEILYTTNNYIKNIDWKKLFKKREDPHFKRMYEILKECEEIEKSGVMNSKGWEDKGRIYAISLVNEGDSLYRKILGEKSGIHCEENFPDAKDKLKDFRDKIINYNKKRKEVEN
jgi:hypothetical protein